jgi:hypothetical protein
MVMNDRELIDYCELHCESERALFKGIHINRMLELAGHPKGFVSSVGYDEWVSVHDPMKELCKIARERFGKANITSRKGAQIIQFPASTHA